jgi:hypothetical protein
MSKSAYLNDSTVLTLFRYFLRHTKKKKKTCRTEVEVCRRDGSNYEKVQKHVSTNPFET